MTTAPNSSLLSVTTPLGPDAVQLAGFSGKEELSRMFRFELDLLSERDVVAADVVGRDISWSVRPAGGQPRRFHGIVRTLSADDGAGDRRSFRAVVVPRLWLLTRGIDCRIFQDRTLPEIVAEVFGVRGFSGYELNLKHSRVRRDVRVQYRESDFAFVSRLLEEEGVFYFFRHGEDKHTLMLADDRDAYRDCQEKQARYDAGTVAPDRIASWKRRYVISPGAWTPTDEADETAFPGETANGRSTAEETPHEVIAGSGGCCTFTPAGKFTLHGHRRDAENQDYALVVVEHAATADSRSYVNTFLCIPDSVTFRPAPVTPQPLVGGPLLAVVVGPKDEEKGGNYDGRVRVRFLWGETGESDKNTCTVCVIGWGTEGERGASFRPSVGQEVVVNFLDGDPDQPVILERMSGERIDDATKGRGVRIESGDDALTITRGDQTTRLDLGRYVTEAQVIELRVGPSVIKMEQTGVTIQGMVVTIEGHAQAEVKGLMTRVGADAVLTVKGSTTVIG